MNRTVSQRAIADLTGLNRETVKRRLASVTPCGSNGNGALYAIGEAMRACFDYYRDEADIELNEREVATAKERLQVMKDFQHAVPSEYVATALSIICDRLTIDGIPERKRERIMAELYESIWGLEDEAKSERREAYQQWKDEMFSLPKPTPAQ